MVVGAERDISTSCLHYFRAVSLLKSMNCILNLIAFCHYSFLKGKSVINNHANMLDSFHFCSILRSSQTWQNSILTQYLIKKKKKYPNTINKSVVSLQTATGFTVMLGNWGTCTFFILLSGIIFMQYANHFSPSLSLCLNQKQLICS